MRYRYDRSLYTSVSINVSFELPAVYFENIKSDLVDEKTKKNK